MAKMSKKLKEIKKWSEIINRYTIPYPDTPIFQPLTFTEIRTAGWLPIETAPKDGTDVLVYSLGRVVSAYFSKSQDEWLEVIHNYSFYAPTHWMPLPEPPKEGE